RPHALPHADNLTTIGLRHVVQPRHLAREARSMAASRRTHSRRSMSANGGGTHRIVLGAIAIGTLVLSGCAGPDDSTLEPIDTPTASSPEPSEQPTTAPEPE